MPPPMSLEAHIRALVDEADQNPTADEEYFVDLLCRRDLAESAASDIYRFTQLAAGRYVLAGKGVKFVDTFFRFDKTGCLIFEGSLPNEAEFTEAMRLMPVILTRKAAEVLALSSSEVQAVHASLENGSKPENLRLAPCVLFNGSPGPEAIKKIQDFIASWLRDDVRPEKKTDRSWWKLW